MSHLRDFPLHTSFLSPLENIETLVFIFKIAGMVESGLKS